MQIRNMYYSWDIIIENVKTLVLSGILMEKSKC